MTVKYSRFRHNAKQTSFTSPTGPRRQGGEHAQYPTNDDVTSGWSCRRPENVSILSFLILAERSARFLIDVLISCYRYVILLGTETQRGIQKSSRGRSQVLSWNKNKTRARIVFSRPRSLKERCTRSMEKPHMPASAELNYPSIGFTSPGQRRRYQCFRYVSSDLQHPAVKRVLLL